MEGFVRYMIVAGRRSRFKNTTDFIGVLNTLFIKFHSRFYSGFLKKGMASWRFNPSSLFPPHQKAGCPLNYPK